MTDPDQARLPDENSGAGGETRFQAESVRSSSPENYGIHPALTALLFLIGVFISYQLIGSVLTLLFVGMKIDESTVQEMRAATMIGQAVFLLGPALLAPRLFGWKTAATLKLRSVGWEQIGLAVVMVIALQFVLQGYMQLQEYALNEYLLPDSLKSILQKIEELIQGMYAELLVMRSPMELLYVWLVVALTPAVCEEAVFRGVTQSAFERGLRPRWALLLTSAAFALFHMYPTQLVPLAAIGLLLGALVWRSGSIWTGIAGHLANNTFAVLVLYFGGAGEAGVKDVTAGPSTGIGAVMSAAGILLLAAGLYRFRRITSARVSAEENSTQ